ncbi:hypothetical protein ATE67_16850 [Sphingopyxis sp. H050]|jgi:hypothetical protein|uniref:hypothetical protein n=1 Tax=Sphingopyxis sp. H050 TaxID=1759072 RepID=UPI0007360546|nr:hypothetical protein [Sphingopyxis sp. H050]KTE18766.1 hypothetical protein ATE67_16850 [Sphingopyxis sp. H050]
MTTESPNSPAFMLYRVDGNGPEARWTRIGAAWANKDRKGFNLLCDAVPLQGRIVMRAYTPKPKAQAEADTDADSKAAASARKAGGR